MIARAKCGGKQVRMRVCACLYLQDRGSRDEAPPKSATAAFSVRMALSYVHIEAGDARYFTSVSVRPPNAIFGVFSRVQIGRITDCTELVATGPK
jgi:hypothetical protein